MAHSKTTPVRSTLRDVLSPQRIKSAAKQHKVVRRQRKLNLFLLVCGPWFWASRSVPRGP